MKRVTWATRIRTLKTWCVYDPATGETYDWCATKKVAKLVARRGHVIVLMKGTYAMPRHLLGK